MAKEDGRVKGVRGRLMALALGLSPFILLEVLLWVIGYRGDPFTTLAYERKVFQRVGDMVELTPARKRQFRTKPFPASKPAGTRRIFILGDSVTWGFYNEAEDRPLKHAYPEILQRMLRERHPGIEVEIVNCGGRGHASFRLLPLLREVLGYEPDLVVVMTGSSEFLEARFYKDWESYRTSHIGWLRCWKTLVLCRDILRVALARSNEKETEAEPYITAEDLVREPYEVDAVIEHSKHNLRLMVETARKAGVPLILSTVPANLRRPPNRTLPWNSTAEEKRRFASELRQARKLASQQKFKECIAKLNSLTARYGDQPCSAHIYYLLGNTYDALGEFSKAKQMYMKAKDLDPMPLRVFSEFNDAIRKSASGGGVYVADVERVFEEAVDDGIPDRRLFLDSCHPRPFAHTLIARALLKVIEEKSLLSVR